MCTFFISREVYAGYILDHPGCFYVVKSTETFAEKLALKISYRKQQQNYTYKLSICKQMQRFQLTDMQYFLERKK